MPIKKGIFKIYWIRIGDRWNRRNLNTTNF